MFYSLLFLTLIYVFICIRSNIFYSKYNIHSNNICGIIKDIKNENIYIDDLLIKYNKNKDNYNYQIGDKVCINGNLEIPYTATNKNLFDYKNYLYSNNIHFVVNINKIELIDNKVNIKYLIKRKIINYLKKYRSKNYLETFIYGNKDGLEDKVKNSYNENGIIKKYRSKNYLETFIYGNKDGLEDKVKNSYNENGISHLLAISGMHISLYIGIIMFLLKKINKFFKYLFIVIFLLFYCFLTNFSASVIRATLFFLLNLLNIKFKINMKATSILLIILCLSLIYNPYYIYNTGFKYSYVISFFLIKYKHLFVNKNYFSKLFIISFISFIFSIPIMINNNFNINFLSILLNIIFVPLVSFIIFPLSLLVLFFPFLENIYIFFISIFEQLSLFFSNIKILNISFCYMNLFTILIYYIFVIIIFNMLEEKKYKYLFFIIIFLFIHKNINYLNIYTKVSFINVGQGDTILIELPHNKGNILIDCCEKEKGNITLNSILPFIKSHGINKIDYFIITHGDFDHMGGAIDLVNNFKVENVIFNCGKFNDLEKELIKVLDKKKIKNYSCIKALNIDDNKLYFLQTKEYDNENDNSNVIYTELNGYKFMFMGDAGIDKEKDILNKYNIYNIDVLKVGHHGSKTSSSKDFIDEINPKYSIISVGKNNRYGHPNKEVLDNLNESKIYRTDEDGSIIFKIKNNKLRIETCTP